MAEVLETQLKLIEQQVRTGRLVYNSCQSLHSCLLLTIHSCNITDCFFFIVFCHLSPSEWLLGKFSAVSAGLGCKSMLSHMLLHTVAGWSRATCHLCSVRRCRQHSCCHTGAQGAGREAALRVRRSWPVEVQGEQDTMVVFCVASLYGRRALVIAHVVE